ncbi:MAG: Ldh family oxidoreductase [Actinomycetota bacterium]|nr:Ldh family oxidoreductase [Actinomycetota bacterium]
MFRADSLRAFCHEVFLSCEMAQEDAAILADSLVQANLRGVDSHGVTRVGIYVKRLKMGLVNPHPNVGVVRESAATLLVDGDNGMGQVVGVRALDLGLDKMKESGAASVGVRRSNHYGAGAYYVQRAVAKDAVAFAYSNAPPTMAPWGGVDPYVGTNPYAYGVPASEHRPIILDMATSIVARGKIILAAERNEPIPEGWAVDKQGNPTTDAQEALEGSVLPFGGPKGYAISLMIDIMAGALTGAGFGPRVNSLYDDFDEPQNVGAFFQLIDIGHFAEPVTFKAKVDRMIEEIKFSRKAAGTEEIFLPGEIEFRMEQERRASGIPVGAETVAELREVGRSCSVDMTDFVLQA